MKPITIYKYDVPFPEGTLLIPSVGPVRAIQMQDGAPRMWIEVDPDQPPIPRRFVVIGTGHKIPDGGTYVGSWQTPMLVWHLYEVEHN